MKSRMVNCAFAILLALEAWTVVPNPSGLATAAPLVEPSARYGHTMVTIGNSVYLFGGYDATSSNPASGGPRRPLPVPTNDLWKFNKDQEWEQLTPVNPPAARQLHAATAANGKMYLSGGKNATGMLCSDE